MIALILCIVILLVQNVLPMSLICCVPSHISPHFWVIFRKMYHNWHLGLFCATTVFHRSNPWRHLFALMISTDNFEVVRFVWCMSLLHKMSQSFCRPWDKREEICVKLRSLGWVWGQLCNIQVKRLGRGDKKEISEKPRSPTGGFKEWRREFWWGAYSSIRHFGEDARACVFVVVV